MIQFFRLLLAIITGAIIFIKELKGFVESTKPFFLSNQPLIIEPMKEDKPKMDMKSYQLEMEKLFHNNQLFPRIKKEFTKSEINFRGMMLAHDIDQDFGFALLVQMALHKRATLPVMVGILRKHFKGDSQKTANELFKACMADLVDWQPTSEQFIVKYDISSDVQEDLDRYQYPLPMIVLPKQIKSNTDTGYFTATDSVILKDNHHDNDVCLDHLNRMNQVKLSINHTTAAMIHNEWKNLDKCKPGEDRREWQKRVKAFEKYDRTARDVMAHLEIAGNEFYLTHKYDKRGRVYCQGYHVNYQGNAWNKAVVEFVNEEVPNG